MNLNFLTLGRACRQAATLLTAREDQVLTMSGCAALKLHLLVCEACPEFENQVLTLRAAICQWRNYMGEPASNGTVSKPARLASPDMLPRQRLKPCHIHQISVSIAVTGCNLQN